MQNYNPKLTDHAKLLRREATPWERKLWYLFLSNYTPRFQRQKVISNYIVDFYCAKAKLAIELDGGGHFTDEQLLYDSYRTKELQEYGFHVIRFSNRDVDNNFKGVCEAIDIAVKKALTVER